jgi:hypothetical protein
MTTHFPTFKINLNYQNNFTDPITREVIEKTVEEYIHEDKDNIVILYNNGGNSENNYFLTTRDNLTNIFLDESNAFYACRRTTKTVTINSNNYIPDQTYLSLKSIGLITTNNYCIVDHYLHVSLGDREFLYDTTYKNQLFALHNLKKTYPSYISLNQASTQFARSSSLHCQEGYESPISILLTAQPATRDYNQNLNEPDDSNFDPIQVPTQLNTSPLAPLPPLYEPNSPPYAPHSPPYEPQSPPGPPPGYGDTPPFMPNSPPGPPPPLTMDDLRVDNIRSPSTPSSADNSIHQIDIESDNDSFIHIHRGREIDFGRIARPTGRPYYDRRQDIYINQEQTQRPLYDEVRSQIGMNNEIENIHEFLRRMLEMLTSKTDDNEMYTAQALYEEGSFDILLDEIKNILTPKYYTLVNNNLNVMTINNFNEEIQEIKDEYSAFAVYNQEVGEFFEDQSFINFVLYVNDIMSDIQESINQSMNIGSSTEGEEEEEENPDLMENDVQDGGNKKKKYKKNKKSKKSKKKTNRKTNRKTKRKNTK